MTGPEVRGGSGRGRLMVLRRHLTGRHPLSRLCGQRRQVPGRTRGRRRQEIVHLVGIDLRPPQRAGRSLRHGGDGCSSSGGVRDGRTGGQAEETGSFARQQQGGRVVGVEEEGWQSGRTRIPDSCHQALHRLSFQVREARRVAETFCDMLVSEVRERRPTVLTFGERVAVDL